MKIADEINPQKVKCEGEGLNPEGVRNMEPARFMVDATEAGEALLEATVADQMGKSLTIWLSAIAPARFTVGVTEAGQALL